MDISVSLLYHKIGFLWAQAILSFGSINILIYESTKELDTLKYINSDTISCEEVLWLIQMMEQARAGLMMIVCIFTHSCMDYAKGHEHVFIAKPMQLIFFFRYFSQHLRYD